MIQWRFFEAQLASIRSCAWELPILFAVASWVAATVSCQHNPSHQSVEEAYVSAQEAYDDGYYQRAIDELKEFRSRHPYSRFATEADLYIANSHFELREYPQASLAYQQFVILHPDHPQADFALYRIGLSYWKEAPSAPNREQDLTTKALKFWGRLQQKHPRSPYLKEIAPQRKEGRQRLAYSELFVIRYYFQQAKWLSCIYRVHDVVRKNAQRDELDVVLDEVLTLGIGALDEILEDFPQNIPALGEHLFTRYENIEEARTFFESTKAGWQSLRQKHGSSSL